MTAQDSDDQMAPTRYFDQQFQCEAVKILPGEYFITNRDTLIVTMLGTCVSVCLRDPQSGIGGMNHFMLPDGDPRRESGKYGTYAMQVLIDHLLKLGARRAGFEAKVFGGGHVVSAFENNHIGMRNVEFALHFLRTARIPVVARDVLETHARKLYFFPATGRVLVRSISTLNNSTLLDREAAYLERINSHAIERHSAGTRDASGQTDSID
jgi:chemotaxis protein CheD